VTTPLLEDLRQAAEPPAPKDFRPGVVYAGRMPSEITTGAIEPVETEEEWEAAVRAMGVHLPEGYGLHLVEAVLAGSTDPAAWHRDIDDAKQNLAHSAYTAPKTTQRWRYRFRVVLKDPRADADIATLMAEAKKAKRGRPLTTRTGGSMIISLADFQVGKTDFLGGTAELLERSELALIAKLAEARRLRPQQIVLVDAGDSTEGFESAPNANRTNDLSQTEQIRVWRRILWRWIEAFAKVTEDLVVIGVPSNHCRVRAGKSPLGDALDDWGIEVIAQVSDIAAGNPESFGHVRFIVPNEHEEHVLFTLLDGQVLGVIHGHQVNKPEQLVEKIKANSRRGIGQADIVICGHFHHLRLLAFGDGQYLIVSPTNDGGSSWFQYSGERSQPGVLSVLIDVDGWRDLHIAWTG
jgi:hypothetical protein